MRGPVNQFQSKAMSLQYPIIIDNEPELCRLIRDIFKQAVKDPASELPEFMSRQDCYKHRRIGRRIVDDAISSGALKLTVVERRLRIKRNDFLNWINKTK